VHDEGLKYPEWQKPLQELILEFDRDKLPEKVQQVETPIFERLQQLSRGNDGHKFAQGTMLMMQRPSEIMAVELRKSGEVQKVLDKLLLSARK
jgi:hypothetical protein